MLEFLTSWLQKELAEMLAAKFANLEARIAALETPAPQVPPAPPAPPAEPAA